MHSPSNSRRILHSPCVCTYNNVLAFQDLYTSHVHYAVGALPLANNAMHSPSIKPESCQEYEQVGGWPGPKKWRPEVIAVSEQHGALDLAPSKAAHMHTQKRAYKHVQWR